MTIIVSEYGRVLAPHDDDSKGPKEMCVRIATDGARHQLQKENQTPLWTAVRGGPSFGESAFGNGW